MINYSWKLKWLNIKNIFLFHIDYKNAANLSFEKIIDSGRQGTSEETQGLFFWGGGGREWV